MRGRSLFVAAAKTIPACRDTLRDFHLDAATIHPPSREVSERNPSTRRRSWRRSLRRATTEDGRSVGRGKRLENVAAGEL